MYKGKKMVLFYEQRDFLLLGDRQNSHEGIANVLRERDKDKEREKEGQERRSTRKGKEDLRCKLRKIGFDIVLCHSDTCPSPSCGGSDAKSHNIVTSLLTAEKNKFQRGKSRNSAITCKQTGITLSGDEIIGQLYNSNMQLIPFAISPLGLFGPTMNTFLYGIDPMTHAIEPRLFPHASKMAKRSISNAVPSNILHRANEIWRTKHPNKFFGGSYKSPDPLTYVTQQFGSKVCFANGSFGLTAMSYLESGPRSKSCPTHSIADVLSPTTTCTDSVAFRRLCEASPTQTHSPSCRWPQHPSYVAVCS
jgi:hypothetical protein